MVIVGLYYRFELFLIEVVRFLRKNFFNTWIYIQIKILYENRSLDSLKDETAKKLSLTKIRILADESFFEIKLSHKSSRPQRKE